MPLLGWFNDLPAAAIVKPTRRDSAGYPYPQRLVDDPVCACDHFQCDVGVGLR